MHILKQVILPFLLSVVLVSSNTVYVENKCGNGYPVVLRGAYGVIIAQGYINPGQTWTHYFDKNNCHSCNIGINTGRTLLAEFSHMGDRIWWNLSTDAGYQDPPMRFFTTAPNAPNMYCGDPRCPDGTPGDSHINNVGGQYDLIIQYCG